LRPARIVLRAGESEAGRGLARLTIFGAALVALGLALALGNGSPWSPASLFPHLPLLRGVRVFPRFQVLSILGFATLTAVSFSLLSRLSRTRRILHLLAVVLVLGALAPTAFQAAYLVGSIRAVSYRALESFYGTAPGGRAPRAILQRVHGREGYTHQAFLLSKGYWVVNCYEPQSLPARVFFRLGVFPITKPPPKRVAELTRNGITLECGSAPTVAWNLAWSSWLTANVPWRLGRDGRVILSGDRRAPWELTVRAGEDPLRQGGVVSLAVAVALGALLLRWRRRGRRRAGARA
jgi:hypothetical protein